MSDITFHVELHNIPKKDGTHPIRIRITQNRKSKRISTGQSVKKEHWNPEKEEVRKTARDYQMINNVVATKLDDLKKVYRESQVMERDMSVATLASRLKKEVIGDSFLEFADKRVGKMVSPWTRKSQKTILEKLRKYLKGKDLYFNDINFEFLKNYDRYLKGLGNSLNTVHSNMKTIKAIYNEAKDSGYFVPDKVIPWGIYKPKKQKSKRTRLNEEQIIKIEQMNLKPGLNVWHSRNIFLFSFYLQGMRTADVLQLTWDQVKDGRIEYVAEKTDKFRSKKIISKAMAILDFYRYDGISPTSYIFPFLRGKNKKKHTQDEWIKVIGSANATINNHLATFTEKLGVEKLSMHVARHSFADIARKKTGDIYKVSDALDHSSPSVTQGYFNDASRAENDDLVDNVYGE